MRLRSAILGAVIILLSAAQARAFSFQEHRTIVCNAIDAICSKVATLEGYDARKKIVQAYLCSPSCGEHPSPAVTGVHQESLFADVSSLSFGDMVALIDYDSAA